MSNPLKSINIVGIIPDTLELSYKLCPDYFNINSGIWEVSLSEIAVHSSSPFMRDTVFEISSNLVQGYYYPDKKPLAKNNIVLGKFEIAPDNPRILHYFGSPKWFVVNNQPSEIKLFFKEWPTLKTFIANPKFQVSVTLLLRRVK